MDQNTDKEAAMGVLETQTKKYIKDTLEPMGRIWQDDMVQHKDSLKHRISDLELEIQKYEQKLDILQRDACELTDAYEKQSASIECDLDTKVLFQSILDQRLNDEDLALTLFFIRKLFNLIEAQIQQELQRIKKDDSLEKIPLLKVHALRKSDPHLSFCYDKVASELNFDNSGRRDTPLVMLANFYHNFNGDRILGIYHTDKLPESEQMQEYLARLNLAVQDTKLLQAIVHAIQLVSSLLKAFGSKS